MLVYLRVFGVFGAAYHDCMFSTHLRLRMISGIAKKFRVGKGKGVAHDNVYDGMDYGVLSYDSEHQG